MIVSDIAVGVASNIISDGIKRPLALIQKEIVRRKNISRALNSKSIGISTEANLKEAEAIADLSRIIANKEGLLTMEVAEFLREFQKNAMPSAIAQCALCGTNPSHILPSFEMFYDRFPSIPFSPKQIFFAYYEAARIRLETVCDPALLEIIRAQHSELLSELKAVTNCLQRLMTSKLKLSASAIKEARAKICKDIEAQNRYLNVETLKGVRKIKIKQLAIPGRLLPIDAVHVQSAKAPEEGVTTSYQNFRLNIRRNVVLGDPGGGKSTLTQLMCFDLAKLILIEAAGSAKAHIDVSDLKIPLKVIVRSFEAKQKSWPSYSFFEHLADEIKVSLDNDTELAKAFLNTILATGEAVIIFDGLDEVLNVGARRAMAGSIEQFAEIYATCPVLVTSRLVGYRDAPLNDEFSLLGLARFNVQEINQYSQKSIAAVGNENATEARQKASEFLSQTNRVGSDLRNNPLMLGLMVQIFLQRGDVPGNRPEVYRECATLMFEKWDERRDIMADVPRDDVGILDVFGYVAGLMFGDPEKEEGVKREWLTSELKTHFADWFVDRATASKAAFSLVTFLTGRAWVMSEVGHGVYKFTHRTFLEYFFARNLISESRGVDDLVLKNLLPKIKANEWIVVSHLALHMVTHKDGGKSKQAASVIINMLEKPPMPTGQELPFLEFVASSLEYLQIPELKYIQIISSVLDRVVILGSK